MTAVNKDLVNTMKKQTLPRQSAHDPSSSDDSDDSDSSEDSHYRRRQHEHTEHQKNDPIRLCATLTAKLLTKAFK